VLYSLPATADLTKSKEDEAMRAAVKCIF
jgi:hypothetical protein